MKATELIKKLWYCTSPKIKIKEFGKTQLEMVLHTQNTEEWKTLMDFCEVNKYRVETFIVGEYELIINVTSKK